MKLLTNAFCSRLKVFIVILLGFAVANAQEPDETPSSDNSQEQKPSVENETSAIQLEIAQNPGKVFDGDTIIDVAELGWDYSPVKMYTQMKLSDYDKITLYRGVDLTAGVHIRPVARVLWLEAVFFNLARPYDIYGAKSVDDHNAGMGGNFSQFTSWTYRYSSVVVFASEIGNLVFRANFHPETLGVNKDKYKEKELLVKGTARGFQMFLRVAPMGAGRLSENELFEGDTFIQLNDRNRTILQNALRDPQSNVRKAFVLGSFAGVDLKSLFENAEGDDLIPMSENEKTSVFNNIRNELLEKDDFFNYDEADEKDKGKDDVVEI